jgi:hypothetical protein
MDTLRRDHSKLGKIDKDESEGGIRLSSRAFQFTPKTRDLYGAGSIYPVQGYANLVYIFVFNYLGIVCAKTGTGRRRIQRNVGLFQSFLRVIQIEAEFG